MRVVTLTGLVMGFVMMRQIMLDVILTVATVVGIISTLNIVVFVLVMNKIKLHDSDSISSAIVNPYFFKLPSFLRSNPSIRNRVLCSGTLLYLHLTG